MMDLYEELAIYTGRDIDLVKARCHSATVELAWQWPRFADNPIEFYRSTDLYIFELTEWQTRLHQQGWYKWFKQVLEHLKPSSLLDFGGGIGEAVIAAWDAGIRDVSYIDVRNSATLNYALHRVTRREMNVMVGREDGRIQRHDLIVAMDVLEHLCQADAQSRIREFSERAEYLIADPDQQKYSAFFPQHVTHPDLTPYFTNVGGNLWKRK